MRATVDRGDLPLSSQAVAGEARPCIAASKTMSERLLRNGYPLASRSPDSSRRSPNGETLSAYWVARNLLTSSHVHRS